MKRRVLLEPPYNVAMARQSKRREALKNCVHNSCSHPLLPYLSTPLGVTTYNYLIITCSNTRKLSSVLPLLKDALLHWEEKEDLIQKKAVLVH